MKVIDLLNKIANGEEVPKKIKINGYIYEYQGDDYLFIDKNNDNHEYWLFSEGYTNKFQWLDNFLRIEIEVIEDSDNLELLPEDELYEIDGEENINWNFRVLKDKINEMIKDINEIRKEMK